MMADLVCKHCGSSIIERKSKGPHVGIYCKSCGRWLTWLKKGPIPSTIRAQLDRSAQQSEQHNSVEQLNFYPQTESMTACATPIDDIPLPTEAPPTAYEYSEPMPSMPDKPALSVPRGEPLVLLVHGFTEIERANGRCIPLPIDTRVVIEASSIKIYNIATKELLQEISC